MKNVIPIVMAGVIGIYGLIIAVILGGNIPSPTVGTGENIYSIYTGMAHVSFVIGELCCCINSYILMTCFYHNMFLLPSALRWTLLRSLRSSCRRLHWNYW